MPPFGPTIKNFTGDFIWKGAFFAIFQQELQNPTMFDGLLRFQILEKWANSRFPLNIQKQKVLQFQGGFSGGPWPDQGLCPWTPLGAPPPDPRYRLALRALTMARLLPNPKYATDSNLWHTAAYIRLHFLQRQHKLYRIFLRFQFF